MIAASQSHLSRRVDQYINTVCSLSGAPLKSTLHDLFGSNTRIIILGGLVRDLARGGISSRHFDVDVVLDLDLDSVRDLAVAKGAHPNRFGGFGTLHDGWKIDFWALSNTWAATSGYRRIDYPSDIIDTTFFNVDAVGFDIKEGAALLSDDYLVDLRNQILEIKLEPNPSISGNMVRAIRRLKMWRFRSGPRLASFIARYADDEMLSHIIATEKRLYGKSYAEQYSSPYELIEDVTIWSLKDEEQLELKLEREKM